MYNADFDKYIQITDAKSYTPVACALFYQQKMGQTFCNSDASSYLCRPKNKR
jgi:hypothetical protein